MTDYITDTIAAVSTAQGRGAIGIIRMSGRESIGIARRLFRDRGGRMAETLEHRRIYPGSIVDKGSLLDEAVLSVMQGPNSYTGEDLVELSCHGNPLLIKKVLEACLRNGARPAEPGEFTKRAFLNGKIDLTRAEAVSEMIEARSERALQLALTQMKGSIKGYIDKVRESLLDILSDLDARLDFPDEEIEPQSVKRIMARCDELRAGCERLAASQSEGRIIREGLRAVIVGKVNVGKSSLFNALLGGERAIVTEEEGTTRDIIEEEITAYGQGVILTDTAGLGGPGGRAAAESMERSREALRNADLVIFVADRSGPWTERDRHIAGLAAGKRGILVYNKTDLPESINRKGPPEGVDGWVTVDVSAEKGTGLERLKEMIVERGSVKTRENDDGDLIVVNVRHSYALQETCGAMERASRAISEGFPEEVVSLELRAAVDRLGEITGETIGDGILDRIFSRFCIGK